MNVRTRFCVFAVILVVFLVSADLSYAKWPEQEKLTASDGDLDDYFGCCVSVSGDYAIMGAYGDDDFFSTDLGSAYVFKRDGEAWNQEAKLTASDGDLDDSFGYSVSVNGDYAIAGSPFDDDNGADSGSAYIFAPNEANPNNWEQVAKLTASDGAAYDKFGNSVCISGDYAIAGSPFGDGNVSGCGAAYIFKRVGENWSEQEKLIASDGANLDSFGYSVSISGDYAIIGAYGDDTGGTITGSAYIFHFDGINWSQQAKLVASDGAGGDVFGISVSISGDYSIVGAYHDDDNGSNSGSAYIFGPNEADPNNWEQVAKLTASDGAADDFFGISVSISGDYAIVGAWASDDHGDLSGSAYTFKREGEVWSEQAKLTASDSVDGDYFGWSVSVSGDYAIVGAHGDDNNRVDAGAAYIFVRCPDSDSTGDCFVDFMDLSVMGDEWLKGIK